MMSKPHLIKGAAQKAQTIEYLSEVEYYIGKNGKPREEAYWHGAAAHDLGLSNKQVNAKTLDRLLDGFSPSGKKLTQNAGTETREKHGWDCPNSVPKSVSLMFAYSSPEKREDIMRAIEKANRASIKYMEGQTTIRTGSGGETLEKCEGLAVASFVHFSSRDLDPQIHCHNVINNVGLRADGTYGSLDGRELFENFHAAGAIFRSVLARELNQTMGVEIVPDRTGKSFDIKGFSAEMIDGFSGSRKKMLAWIEKHGKDANDPKAMDIAQRLSRNKKVELPLKDLEHIWQAKGAQYGLTKGYTDSLQTGKQQDASQHLNAEEILAETTKQKSTFTRKDVFAKVASKAAQNGGMSAADLEAETDRVLGSYQSVALSVLERNQNGQRLKPELLYTTREMLLTECKLFQDFSEAWNDKDTHKRSEEQIRSAQAAYEKKMSEKIGKPVSMSKEQEDALNHIARGGRQVLIQGFSGTGKSFTMGAVRELEEASGQTVIGCALAGQAANGLGEGAGIKYSQNIAKLLSDIKHGKIKPSKEHTLIVDEAAMVGSRDLRKLQEHFKDSKIIYLGDFQQYQAIEAGGWMLGLQNAYRNATAKLKDITRQKGWHKEAIEKIIDGEGDKALQMMKDNGKVKELPTQLHIVEKIADDYVADNEIMKEKLVMCSTHRAAREVNAAIRSRLIETGYLGADAHTATFAQRQDDGNREKVEFEREIRAGDRLRFTKGNAVMRVENGNGGEIEAIKRLRGDYELTVRMDNGRKINFKLSEYNYLEHGYARTGHSSQGATVNRAFVHADADAVDMSALYVLLSRSRDQSAELSGNTTLYATTDDLFEPPVLDRDGNPVIGKDGQEVRRPSAIGRALVKSHYKDTSAQYLSEETRLDVLQNPEKAIAKLRAKVSGDYAEALNGRQEIDAEKPQVSAQQGQKQAATPGIGNAPAASQSPQVQAPRIGVGMSM